MRKGSSRYGLLCGVYLCIYLSIYLSIVLIPSWAIPESTFIAGHH